MNSHIIFNTPVAVFDVHQICNQRCAYCVAGSAVKGDFGPIVEEDSIRKIGRFFQTHGPFNIVLNGGEPFITPGLSRLLKTFLEADHLISVQTNLKTGATLFSKTIPPERTGWILASFHSIENKNFQTFLQHVLFLKSQGYPIIVKLILDDGMLKTFTRIYDRLLHHNIGVILAPLIYFPPNAEAFSKNYTPQQWAFIAPRITLRSSWLYFAGGWKSIRTLCNAGKEMLYIRALDGTIHGCAHSFPQNIGHMYRGEFSPLTEPIPCGLERCICDFNYYTGVIPNLNDVDSFRELLVGHVAPVSFKSYIDWITQAGIQPTFDLDAIVPGTQHWRSKVARGIEKVEQYMRSSFRN